mgnify:CR=1 FL=1
MQTKGKGVMQEREDHHHIDRPIAILGAGNMGSALMKGIINAKLTPPKKIIACDVNPAKLQTLASEWKVRTTLNIK